MKNKTICLTGLLAALFCASSTNATVIMSLEQVGTNVVATGSGTVNLTSLSPLSPGSSGPEIQSLAALLIQGDGSASAGYTGISGPASFGTSMSTPSASERFRRPARRGRHRQ